MWPRDRVASSKEPNASPHAGADREPHVDLAPQGRLVVPPTERGRDSGRVVSFIENVVESYERTHVNIAPATISAETQMDYCVRPIEDRIGVIDGVGVYPPDSGARPQTESGLERPDTQPDPAGQPIVPTVLDE